MELQLRETEDVSKAADQGQQNESKLKSKISDLRGSLDIEKARCVELTRCVLVYVQVFFGISSLSCFGCSTSY